MLDRALLALITEALERTHADGYANVPQGAESAPTFDPNRWSELPWEDE